MYDLIEQRIEFHGQVTINVYNGFQPDTLLDTLTTDNANEADEFCNYYSNDNTIIEN